LQIAVSRVLIVASIVWPLLLGAAVAANVPSPGARWTSIVYLIGSRICHQRPERSFHTAGVQWPVCGRCSGLYAAAPVGALAAAGSLRRRRRDSSALRVVLLAAVPTILTVPLEWFHLASISNVIRFAAALPLGAAIAFVLVRTAAGPSKPIE
jgi:uncharacterized membrane protein